MWVVCLNIQICESRKMAHLISVPVRIVASKNNSIHKTPPNAYSGAYVYCLIKQDHNLELLPLLRFFPEIIELAFSQLAFGLPPIYHSSWCKRIPFSVDPFALININDVFRCANKTPAVSVMATSGARQMYAITAKCTTGVINLICSLINQGAQVTVLIIERQMQLQP